MRPKYVVEKQDSSLKITNFQTPVDQSSCKTKNSHDTDYSLCKQNDVIIFFCRRRAYSDECQGLDSTHELDWLIILKCT